MWVLTGKEMQEVDRFVIQELGIPGRVLMERAGWWVAKKSQDFFSPRKVLVLCGPGNNGGDGFVAARYLWNWGCDVRTIVLAKEDKYKGESKENFELLKKLEIPFEQPDTPDHVFKLIKEFSPELLIDGIFGTGLSREVGGVYKEVINLINQLKELFEFKVVSIDIPSGVCSYTGKVMGTALRADLTVTFESLKYGHLFYPGKEFAGKVEVVEIGFPKHLIRAKYSPAIYLDKEWAGNTLRPRKGYTHKGKFGHVLIIAGSRGKSGAGLLAALGALRAGAGLVTLAAPESLQCVYSTALPEILTMGLPETSKGEISKSALELLLKACERKKALVIGPGLGLSDEVKTLLFSLLEKIEVPVVLDADALTLIAEDLNILKKCKASKVLTPHPGEAARLLKTPKEELLSDRLSSARRLTELTFSTVVFKGPHSLVCDFSGKCGVSSIDEPGLSQGGTGDVLAGVIGALLAQGYPPFEAACLGVFLHGYSGILLKEIKGPWGYIATEVANVLPQVIKKLKGVFK